MNKKPVIIAAVGVVVIIIVIIVFVPFGGKAPAPTAQVISKKAKITPPVEVANVEPAMADKSKVAPPAPTGKTETSAKPPAIGAGAPDAAKPVITRPTASTTAKPKPGPVETAASAPATKPVTTQTAVAPAATKPVPSKTPVVAAKKAASVPAVKKIIKQWAVNTGSFSSKGEAERFAQKLRDAGYDTVYITKFLKDGVKWHRVRVGFYKTETEARGVETAIIGKFNIDTPWAVKVSKKERMQHN
ncbi:MAG: hypothetical protein A3J24_08555 [Deltaproteobacteria bacterium RIFCSPLOWO2_02_FULL_53_8]|nr:MAG: hypothetical protein A3J24_08555 [Deltaproteobacteria bacterium RIFCSPLOWO2_02_FULL_53_8]